MTKNTLSNRVAALESGQATILAGQARLEAMLGRLAESALGATPTPAVAAPVVKGEVTKVVDTPAKPAPKAKVTAIEGKRCLTAKNREAFIADHAWATKGMSTKALSEAVVVGGQPLTGTWAIGPKRTQMILEAGLYADLANTPTFEIDKDDAPVVAAKVEGTKPAKERTPAQKAADEAPLDANGKRTKKCEWAIREALADSGKYDRNEIDERVAKAYGDPFLAKHFGLVTV